MRCVYRGDLVCLIRSLNPFYEQVLEDIALTVQNQLEAKLPFCAFNGGNDVFVDVGNKSLGLQSLMSYLGAKPKEVRQSLVSTAMGSSLTRSLLPLQTLHVGDRFTLSGNDTATRDVCSVLWVANHQETGFFIKVQTRQGDYIGCRDRPVVPLWELRYGTWEISEINYSYPCCIFLAQMLLKDIRKSRWQPYIE